MFLHVRQNAKISLESFVVVVLDFYRGIGNGNRIGIYSCRCVKQGVLWNPCGISGKGCLRWPHHALRFDISGQPDSDSALACHYVDKALVSFIV